MTHIMKLATDYAQACYHLANPATYDAELAEEARAALQSSIETLQAKLEAANQLARLNGEIAASLKDERDALAKMVKP
jgi:hypothetical protein